MGQNVIKDQFNLAANEIKQKKNRMEYVMNYKKVAISLTST